MTMETTDFYATLKPLPSETGLCDMTRHIAVPDDWSVVVADIAGSTLAVQQGRYRDVNIASACAITAVLNRVGRDRVPYVFGGDGATFLVPPALLFDVAAALYGTRRMVLEQFNLTMRAGIVSAGAMARHGAPVRLARLETAPGIFQAAFSGAGIALAETIVKDKDQGPKHDIASIYDAQKLAAVPASFDGFECRWQPVENRNGLTASVIITARLADDAANTALYQSILHDINLICGPRASWKPVSAPQLRVSVNPLRLWAEAKTRGARLSYLARVACLSALGRLATLFGFQVGHFDGSAYPTQTANQTDFIKFDHALRLVMDITEKQHQALVTLLDGYQKDGRIFYGMQPSRSALMTCIVFDYAKNHFHFIDGGNGGYSLAAKAMKEKIASAS